MGKSTILIKDIFELSDKYRVELRVYRVDPNDKFPFGVKARFALIDVTLSRAVLVVDNHEPFGFHAHLDEAARGPNRHLLEVANFDEALAKFWSLTWRIIGHEE